MGRPPLPADERRSQMIHFRVSEEEGRRLAVLAFLYRITVSQLIRDLAAAEYRRSWEDDPRVLTREDPRT